MSAFASADWVLLGRQVANHLWQSTAFAAVIGLLAFALRKNHARVRHWIWMAASVKFLVPFSAIVALGGYFGQQLAPRAAAPPMPAVAEQIAEPFAAPEVTLAVPSAPLPSRTPLAGLLVAVWFCGCTAVLVGWHRKWRRVAAVVRASAPVGEGRELEAFGRLRRGEEKAKQTRRSAPLCVQWGGPPGLPCFRLKLVSSAAKLEPGIFGIFRPVLWLPKGIGDYLSDAQLEAILAHELCHARRHDNLLAAIHMVVEAAFWFHPLVWWLGARLEEERERACDEEVVRLIGEPRAYAEGVLRVCEFYLASALSCAAGVTGADLKRRIAEIMANQLARELDFSRRVLLASAAVAAIAVPIAVGWLGIAHVAAQTKPDRAGIAASNDRASQAPSPAAQDSQGGHSIRQNRNGQLGEKFHFEVLSIRPIRLAPGAMQGISDPKPNGFSTTATIWQLVAFAYGPPMPASLWVSVRMRNEPSWFADYYAIDARVSQADLSRWQSQSRDHELLRSALRAALEERCQLAVHEQASKEQTYDLVIAKRGPKLKPADPGATLPVRVKLESGGVMKFGLGAEDWNFYGATMRDLAWRLAFVSRGIPVRDRTGITGRYDFSVPHVPREAAEEQVYSYPVDRLGLRLKRGTENRPILVIDHAERPSAN